MASNMEVEGQQQQQQQLQQPEVFVHPLAIVHMSDQFTRVTCGGSPIPMTDPVVGLLYGTTIHGNNINNNKGNGGTEDGSSMMMMNTDQNSNNMNNNNMKNNNSMNNEIHIHDADDTIFPLNLLDDDYCAKQVELHQAVFTTHKAVGWYRVSLSCEPTVSDLEQTQRLRQQYPGQDILFGLLQVPSIVSSSGGADQDKKKPGTKKLAAQDEDDDDEEELPLTLYQVVGSCGGGGGGGEVLVAVPDWKIATSEAERIAVERVISEKLVVVAATASGGGSAAGGTAAGTSSAFAPGVDQAAAIRALTQAAQESSAWYQQTVLVQESWRAIQDRLAILVTFLETVQQRQQQTDTDANASNSAMTMQEHFEQQALLRQVQGLLLQLGTLAATCPVTSSSNKAASTLSSSLQQLSVMAKTIDAVTSYTDKVRLVQDSSIVPTSSGRDIRRF